MIIYNKQIKFILELISDSLIPGLAGVEDDIKHEVRPVGQLIRIA